MTNTATAAKILPVSTDDAGEITMRWATAIMEWTQWLHAAGQSPETIRLRRYAVVRLAEHSTTRSPWRVSTDDLAGWLAAYEWAPETRRAYRAGARSFYRWARLTGHISQDPAQILPSIRVPLKAPRPTPEQRLAATLERADDRTRLAVLFAAYAGLRRGEITRLQWNDLTTDMIHVRGKGGRTRHVPLHPTVAAELAAERARRAAGHRGTGWRHVTDIDVYLFPGQAGGPMSPDTMGRLIAAALGGIWTTHTLRHRFAVRAYQVSGDLGVVQDLLGHASPTTTRIYADPSADALRAAVHGI